MAAMANTQNSEVKKANQNGPVEGRLFMRASRAAAMASFWLAGWTRNFLRAGALRRLSSGAAFSASGRWRAGRALCLGDFAILPALSVLQICPWPAAAPQNRAPGGPPVWRHESQEPHNPVHY